MDKSVSWMIGKAKSLNRDDLKDAIDALEALGEDATGDSGEYKQLSNMVDTQPAPVKKSVKPKETTKVSKGEKKLSKPNMAGITMIGSLFYSGKDNYKAGFSDPIEAARYHNG